MPVTLSFSVLVKRVVFSMFSFVHRCLSTDMQTVALLYSPMLLRFTELPVSGEDHLEAGARSVPARHGRHHVEISDDKSWSKRFRVTSCPNVSNTISKENIVSIIPLGWLTAQIHSSDVVRPQSWTRWPLRMTSSERPPPKWQLNDKSLFRMEKLWFYLHIALGQSSRNKNITLI